MIYKVLPLHNKDYKMKNRESLSESPLSSRTHSANRRREQARLRF